MRDDERRDLGASGSTSRGSPTSCSPGRGCACAASCAGTSFDVRSYDLERRARRPPTSRRCTRRARRCTSPRLRDAGRERARRMHATSATHCPPRCRRARAVAAPLRRARRRCTARATREEAERARRRLALDELLAPAGRAGSDPRRRRTRPRRRSASRASSSERYREALPFELTKHQEQAIAEIDADLAAAKPMQRLLQGDVGSGKTVVALYALLRARRSRQRQGALMAPTETLAEQHFLTLEPLCAELGVRTALLTGLGQERDGRERRADRRRHARADPGRRRVRRPRGRRRRRAAPVRRRAAQALGRAAARRTSCT